MTKVRELIKAPGGLHWTPVPNFKNLYATKNGLIGFKFIGRYFLIKTVQIKKGYTYFSLKGKKYLVHRIICTTFHKNTKNKPSVNHINGIKNDNRTSNLEWCTTSENNTHASHVLNVESQFKKRSVQILRDGNVIDTAISVREAGRKINADWSNISKVCNGKRKQYLGYTFRYAS